MHPGSIYNMFNSFTYEKSSAEIVEKAKAKVIEVSTKIEERQARVNKLRAEYEITDAVLIDLLTQARNAQKRNEAKSSFTYSMSNTAIGSGADGGAGHKGPVEVSIGAGVINNLLTENDFIEAEKEQVKRLNLIIRNLKDLPDDHIHSVGTDGKRVLRGHTMSEEDLKYLGF